MLFCRFVCFCFVVVWCCFSFCFMRCCCLLFMSCLCFMCCFVLVLFMLVLSWLNFMFLLFDFIRYGRTPHDYPFLFEVGSWCRSIRSLSLCLSLCLSVRISLYLSAIQKLRKPTLCYTATQCVWEQTCRNKTCGFTTPHTQILNILTVLHVKMSCWTPALPWRTTNNKQQTTKHNNKNNKNNKQQPTNNK